MNNKITNELLEDYAMLYPRIECVKIGKLRNGNREDGLFIPFDYFLAKRDYPYEIEYIQLRSIESITEEEERKVVEIKSYYDRLDYLREIGVAMKFRGITVDELVESGKLKLI